MNVVIQVGSFNLQLLILLLAIMRKEDETGEKIIWTAGCQNKTAKASARKWTYVSKIH